MSYESVAVLELKSDLHPCKPKKNSLLDWLIENDFDSDVILLVDDEGVVYDVLSHGKSIGYYAIRTFTSVFPELKMAKALRFGNFDEEEIENILIEFDYKAYILSLFGDLNVAE